MSRDSWRLTLYHDDMIYFLHGDRKKVLERSELLLQGLLSEDEGRPHLELRAENFTPARLEEMARARPLFGLAAVVVCSDLLEDPLRRETIEQTIEGLAGAQTIFLFRESELEANGALLFRTHAKIFEEFKSPPQSSSYSPQALFAIGDALAKRDKKIIWVAYQRALLAGHAEEEIFWTLVRQLKNMALVKRGGSLSDLGTKSDFVYKKAVSNAKNFSFAELTKFHGQLVAIFHDSHRGLVDFDVALERWLLRI